MTQWADFHLRGGNYGLFDLVDQIALTGANCIAILVDGGYGVWGVGGSTVASPPRPWPRGS